MTHSQKLAQEKISTLLLQFSIPCILSLLVSSLYNIVDQIFIGRGIGYLGNGATTVVFPITIITLAISLLVGDGCSAFLSLCFGRKDNKNAEKTLCSAVILLIAIGVIFSIVFILCRDNLLTLFGATKNNLSYAREYMNYIIIGIPFFMFANGMNSIIRADGSPKYAMISTFIGAIINIILDPIAIFILHWGMMGAAVATITGQIISAFLSFIYLFHMKNINLEKRYFKLDINNIKKFIPLGISSFITQVSIVIIMVVSNNMLVIYGASSKFGSDIPLTVVGIVMKVFQIVIAFVVGVAVGAQPIVGFNYGAKLYDRVLQTFKTVLKIEIVIGIIATFIFEFFPMEIIKIFGSENALYNEFAISAFRIYFIFITLCCIQKASYIFMQSLGKPKMATILALAREVICMVPLTLILPHFLGVKGVLFSAPIADFITCFISAFSIKKVVSHINTEKKEDKETINNLNIQSSEV